MTQVGIQYAQALYDLAKEACVEQTLLHQLQAMSESFSQEKDFLRLLSAPNIPKAERCDVIDRSFRGRVHPYVLNFLKILTERGYARYFDDCCKAYESQYNTDHGILPVCAVSAVELTDDQKERLTKKLAKLTGKTVTLTSRVDADCLGGIRLHYDGVQVDGTVKNRLDRLGRQLKNTVL